MTDRWTDDLGKTNMSPNPEGGDINIRDAFHFPEVHRSMNAMGPVLIKRDALFDEHQNKVSFSSVSMHVKARNVFQVTRPNQGFCPCPKHFIVNCNKIILN